MPPAPRRLTAPVRAVMVLLVTMLLAISATALTSAAANAAEKSSLAVTLQALAPGTLTPSNDLKVTARVRNNGSANLSGAKATVSLGSQALDSLEAQQRWRTSDRDLTSSKNATTDVPDLAPGASTDVTLTLPSSDIDVSFAMTTLPVEVMVRGAAGGQQTQGAVRTSIPWTSTSETFTKMSSQVVVPISLPADPELFSASGSARFRAWNKAIGPGSAIDSLLSSAPSVPVTWLIDPTVLDPPTAQDGRLPATSTGTTSTTSGTSSTATSTPENSSPSAASSPTSGATSSGTTTPGTSGTASPAPEQLTTVDALAERLRRMLGQRPSTQQVWFTPYGDPDLSTLTSSRRPSHADSLLKRMLARHLPQQLTDISRTVVAAPAAPLDAGSAQRLDAAWRAARGESPTVITPKATLDGNSSASVNSVASRGPSGGTVLGVDASLSETLSSTAMTDAEAGAEARSRSLAVYQQQPSTSRSILLMASRQSISAARLRSIASSLSSSAWIQPAAADAHKTSAASPTAVFSDVAPRQDGVWPQPSTSALDSRDTGLLVTNLAHLTRYAGIVDDSEDIVPAWSRSLDQAVSTRWRGHTDRVDALVESSRQTVESIPGRVSVLPSGTINFFTDSGRITVTVRNDLARIVRGVKVHLVPRSYAVRFTAQPEAVTLDPGSRAGVRVPTAAMAAGSVDILATATADNGVELGQGANDPVRFTINARPTGTWIYWALGIVALLVFCYGLARNHKRGTRRRDELARDIQL